MNPYSRVQPGQQAMRQAPAPQLQTSGGMGPYAPRVQATQLQRRPMQQPAPKSGGGGGGMMGGMAGGMMGGLSDERSKKEIAQLESANDALTKALGAANGEGAPGEYMRGLAPKSGGKFAERYSEGLAGAAEYPYQWDARDHGARAVSPADTPAANTVAAQNVGMQPQGAPQPAPAPVARTGGFNVGGGMPDLSALDEAYRRIGKEQGGG